MRSLEETVYYRCGSYPSEFSYSPENAKVTARIHADGSVDLTIAGTLDDLASSIGHLTVERITEAVQRYVVVKKTLALNPADTGLVLAEIRVDLRFETGYITRYGNLNSIDQGWLTSSAAEKCSGWVAADADLDDPLCPILLPRATDAHEVDWVVIQPGIDKEFNENTEGLLSFPWDDEDGMAAAAQTLLTASIEEVSAMRALSNFEAMRAYRGKADAVAHRRALYAAFHNSRHRTPQTLLAPLRTVHGYNAEVAPCYITDPGTTMEPPGAKPARRNVCIRLTGLRPHAAKTDWWPERDKLKDVTDGMLSEFILRAQTETGQPLTLIRVADTGDTMLSGSALFICRKPEAVAPLLREFYVADRSYHRAWGAKERKQDIQQLDPATATWTTVDSPRDETVAAP